MNDVEMDLIAIEVVQTSATQDRDNIWHAVCHCTGDEVSACGLDCSDSPWSDATVDEPCPLCMLAWPDGAPTCPWGCGCADECAPCGDPS